MGFSKYSGHLGKKTFMKWPKWHRSWIPGIVFWVLFLGSLALGKRYPWLDAVWYWAWMFFLLVVGLYAVTQIFRNRHETGGFVGYRGVPRWVVTLFGGEVDPSAKPPKKQ
jgi:hypothetical protein